MLVSEPERAGRGADALFWAVGVSAAGDGLRFTAFPLMAVAMTDSPSAIALVSALGTLPWLVLGLPAGLYADRYDRFGIMIAADVARIAVLGFAVALVVTHTLTFELLLVLAAVMGVGEVVFDCAALAVIPTLVPPHRIAWASGRFIAAHTGGKDLVGYALAGPLFALSRAAPLVADALTFAGSALVVSRLRRQVGPAAPRTASPGVLAELRQGVPALLGDPRMASLTGIAAALNLVFLGQVSVMAVFVVKVLKVAPEMLGILLLVGAVGGVCGSLVAARAWAALGDLRTLLLSLATAGLASAAIAVGDLWTVCACLFLGGLASSVYHVVAGAVRLTIIPDELLGRTAGAYRMFTWGAMPLGALCYGLMAQVWGLGWPFVVGGLLIVGLAPVCVAAFRGSDIRAGARA